MSDAVLFGLLMGAVALAAAGKLRPAWSGPCALLSALCAVAFSAAALTAGVDLGQLSAALLLPGAVSLLPPRQGRGEGEG